MQYPQGGPAAVGALALMMTTWGLAGFAAAQDDFEQHGVHQHGLVTVNVAVDGTALRVEVHTPADSVIGFEHAPRSDEERARVDEMNAWLRSGRQMVMVPAAARCRLDRTSVDAPQWDASEGHDHGSHGHDDHSAEDHAGHEHRSAGRHEGRHRDDSTKPHDDNAHGAADHSAGHDHHQDYHITVDYRCDQPAALRWLQLTMLDRLREVQQVRVQVLTPTRQATDTLTDSTTRVQLR